MEHILIDIREAVVSHRDTMALKCISLKVNRGEFLGILGPNGAGKTTLLNLINGMAKATEGQVRILGHQLTPANGHSLRKKVGYVTQIQNIEPRMPVSVREAVIIGRYGQLGFFKVPGKNDWKAVDEVLELVGLTNLAQKPIGHLSGGEQQRVAIARCLAQEPEIFLLDEATASLDLKAKGNILQLVKLLHNTKHLTTLFVTHDLNSLPDSCTRIILMKQGIIWNQGSPKIMLTESNFSNLYDMPANELTNTMIRGIAYKQTRAN
jgi:ABC-type cobalamin/Fe3+-siderophores transport system ATPase subunit